MAIKAESLEYDSVWIGEGWEHDIFIKLAEIANQTNEITLGSGIANVYTRTPTVLAMATGSLHRLSGGRFILGIGASHPPLIEDYHGLTYENPIQRLKETFEIVSGLTRDEGSFTYNGEIFHIENVPTQQSDVPIYNAAIGAKNRLLTGRKFDGWIPYGIPYPVLQDSLKRVREGQKELKRADDSVAVVPWITAAVSEDGESACEAVRKHIVEFVGKFDAYKRAFGQKYPKECTRIFQAVENGDTDEALTQITDEMVDTFGIAGTPKSGRNQLRTIANQNFIDSVVISTPRTATDSIIENTVDALAPDKL